MNIDIKPYGYGENKYFVATIRDGGTTIETEDIDWSHLIEVGDTIARHKNKENELAKVLMNKVRELFTDEEYHDFIQEYVPNEVFEERGIEIIRAIEKLNSHLGPLQYTKLKNN